MKQEVEITYLYDGRAIVETPDAVYTYYLDGAAVYRAQEIGRYAPHRAWNMIKLHAGDNYTKEVKMRKKTDAAAAVKWHKTIEALKKKMMKEGRFSLWMQGKSYKVIPATHHSDDCPKRNSRITGVIFYKWTPTGILKIVVVCMTCGVKTKPEITIRPVEYDTDNPKYKGPHEFLYKHRIKWWTLPK